MKKEVILLGVLFMLVLPLATALNVSIESNARGCITDAVQDRTCSTFGLEDKIFSLLSTGQCQSELLDSSTGGECFTPSNANSCEIKTTAQAVLALSKTSSDKDDYIDWIFSKNKTATNIEWLIQIESPGATLCAIEDLDGNQYSVSVGEDKKVTLSGAGNCLGVDSTGYWLVMKTSCQDQEFEIECDESFQTNPLFKKKTSSTVYVLDENPQAVSGGGSTLIKQRKALCFGDGSFCDYEGSMWAVTVLKKLNYDMSSYLPYLVAFEPENKGLLPESFLYQLTGGANFRLDLISKQIANSYWNEDGGKYYDTAVALLPLFNENPEAKTNAEKWLADVQGENGCWDSGSIARTGFLLYALSPGFFIEGNGGGQEDCESLGNYCIRDVECSNVGGNLLSSLSCPSLFDSCCDKNELEKTCEDLDGEICDDFDQECLGDPDYTASDTGYGETCCLGTCQEITATATENECEQNLGTCNELGCEAGEEEISLSCDFSYESCCLPKEETPSYWWIWVLIVLITLAGAAIVFRDKLKEYYIKFKTRKGPSKPGQMPPRRPRGPPPGVPPGVPPRGPPRSPPRRIIPASRAPPKRIPQGKKSELDDVLKKLKEMGK